MIQGSKLPAAKQKTRKIQQPLSTRYRTVGQLVRILLRIIQNPIKSAKGDSEQEDRGKGKEGG